MTHHAANPHRRATKTLWSMTSPAKDPLVDDSPAVGTRSAAAENPLAHHAANPLRRTPTTLWSMTSPAKDPLVDDSPIVGSEISGRGEPKTLWSMTHHAANPLRRARRAKDPLVDDSPRRQPRAHCADDSTTFLPPTGHGRLGGIAIHADDRRTHHGTATKGTRQSECDDRARYATVRG